MNSAAIKMRLKNKRLDIKSEMGFLDNEIAYFYDSIMQVENQNFLKKIGSKNQILEWKSALYRLQKRRDFLLYIDKEIGYMIESFDSEEAKRPCPLAKVLEVLKFSDFGEDSMQLFGMFAHAINRFSLVKRYRYLCEEDMDVSWDHMFNKDGSFKIDVLTQEIEMKFALLLEMGYEDLWQDFKSLASMVVKINDGQVLEEKTTEVSEVEVLENPYRRELGRYYSNYRLIRRPSDEEMPNFLSLLDKCLIDDAERRYILSLFSEPTFDGEFCTDAVLEGRDSDDNDCILFLGGADHTCFLEDMEFVDKGLLMRFKSLFDYKINSKNKRFFKRVLEQSNLAYPLYYVSNGSVCVFFVEARDNLFVIVGGGLARTGFDKMIKRTLLHQEEIDDYLRKLDDDEKLGLIESHQKILFSLSLHLNTNYSLQRRRNNSNNSNKPNKSN